MATVLEDVKNRLMGSRTDDIDMAPSPRHAARGPISICGWLYKMKRRQRAFTPSWVLRWFTIEAGRLTWYGKKASDQQHGFIHLLSVSGVQEFEGSKDGVYSFIVRSSDRTLLLRAQSQRDMDRWVNNIRLQIHVLRDQGSTTPRGSGSTASSEGRRHTFGHVLIGQLETALEEIEKLEADSKEHDTSDEDDEQPERLEVAPSTANRRRSQEQQQTSREERHDDAPGAKLRDGGEGTNRRHERGLIEKHRGSHGPTGSGALDTSSPSPRRVEGGSYREGRVRAPPAEPKGNRGVPPPMPKGDRVLIRPQPPRRQASGDKRKASP